MKPNAPRTWPVALLLILCALCFVSVTGWLLASPSDEISQAVAAGGTKEVKQADADTFLDALASVLVTVPKKESPAYVAAATEMRPDLKAGIQNEAAEVYGGANDTDDADKRRRSRHRRKVPICCHCPNPDSCHTLYLPPREARAFLEKHPECRRGVCPNG
jgi:hypothetical protein